MPGSPNQKIVVTGADRQAFMTTGTANLKAALRTQAGLEHLQKLIEENTSPPAIVSLAAIDAWVAAIP